MSSPQAENCTLPHCQCGCASQQIRMVNVRFGSKADIDPCSHDVRFTPKSGLVQCRKKILRRGFYMRAMAIFEVMLALTFPSLRSGPRCASIAAFSLSCVPAGNVARDGASG